MTGTYDRFYYQCRICLSTFTVEGERLPHGTECVCGGTLRYMGPVTQEKWLDIQQRPACDGRCISARGPHCDCRCGGENHGKGIIATVIREGGKVVVRPPDDEALVRAQEFRQAVKAFKALMEKVYGEDYHDYVQNRWCRRWHEINRIMSQFQHVYKYRRHSTRMKKLNDLISDLQERAGVGIGR